MKKILAITIGLVTILILFTKSSYAMNNKQFNQFTVKNGWVQVGNEWNYYENDIMVKNDWRFIREYWYYFESDGIMVKDVQDYSVQNSSGEYDNYGFDSNGHLIINQWVRSISHPEEWFYRGSSGKYLSGWQVINDKQYYFGNMNIMATDVVIIDNKYYLFGENGVFIKEVNKENGWNLHGGSYYYVENGNTVKGFKNINGLTYYFKENGKMITDYVVIVDEETKEDKIYYFECTGALKKNKWTYDSLRKKWNYSKSDGVGATNEWLLLNNKWYYFDDNSEMVDSNTIIDEKLYCFNSDGSWKGNSLNKSTLNGWYIVDKKWKYYINGDEATGWQKINGTWYMFDRFDNTMSVGIQYDDVQKCYYYFNENGIYQCNGWYNDSNGNWVYAGSNGILLEGWQKINGNWYYLTPTMNNERLIEIDDVYYEFSSNGIYIGRYNPKLGWNKVQDQWYYFKKDGKQAKGILMINNQYYFFQPSMQTNTKYFSSIFSDNGTMVSNGWYLLNGKWMYANQLGVFFRSQVRTINGKTYQFDRYGNMI